MRQQFPGFPERNKPAPPFIPQCQSDAPNAFPQRYAANARQFRMSAQYFWKSVVWNTTSEMMNVVNANIPRQPSKHQREVIVRSAMESRFRKLPVVGL